MQVSVIVVNYNGLRFLDAFFASMQRAFERHTHELIVVDNASTDGSLEWLRRRRDIRLVELATNTGFTAGNHEGAAWARGQVLVLLNNDTQLAGPLDALVDAALDPQVGAVGCRLHHGDGRLQYSVGLEHTVPRLVLSWLGLEKRPGAPRLLRKFETDPAFYAQRHEQVAWVSGACLATRKSVWDRLGGLDPEFFMYCEDVDYGRRVRQLGLRVSYLPAPCVIHHEGGGKAWVGSRALRHTARAYFLYTRKASGTGAARGLSALLALVFALRSLVFAGRALACRDVSRRALHHDKAGGYGRACAGLSRAALSGRPPPLA
jgi:GT2 family glycosyltransferase